MNTFSQRELIIEFFRDGQRRTVRVVTCHTAHAQELRTELIKRAQCFVTLASVSNGGESNVAALAKDIIAINSIPPIAKTPAASEEPASTPSTNETTIPVKKSLKRLFGDEKDGDTLVEEEEVIARPAKIPARPTLKRYLSKWCIYRPSTVSLRCEECGEHVTYCVITTPGGATSNQIHKRFLCKEHAVESYKAKYGSPIDENDGEEKALKDDVQRKADFEAAVANPDSPVGKDLQTFLDRVSNPWLQCKPMCEHCKDDAPFTISVNLGSLAGNRMANVYHPMCKIHAEEHHRYYNNKYKEFIQPGASGVVVEKKNAFTRALQGRLELERLVKKYCDKHHKTAPDVMCNTPGCNLRSGYRFTVSSYNARRQCSEDIMIYRCFHHIDSNLLSMSPYIPSRCTLCTAPAKTFGIGSGTVVGQEHLEFEFHCDKHVKANDVPI